MPRFGLSYEMRYPSFASGTRAQQYAAMLDQCEYCDRHGFESLLLFEHHGTDDGYLPSPLVLATAAAARTRRISLEPLIVAPFHEPLRLAEDLAVCDLVSGGRLKPTLAVGYRAEEFAMFGRALQERRRALEHTIDVLRRAWTGEPFELDGRTVRVTPRPAQRPHPPIVVGGNSTAAARTAARLGDGFSPMTPKSWGAYRRERIALGKADPGPAPRSLPVFFLHVAEDPERDLAQLTPFLLHAIRTYGGWTTQNARAIGDDAKPWFDVEDEAELRTSPLFRVLTPDDAVALLAPLGDEVRVLVRPMWGGHDPALAWSSLELLVTRVIPQLRQLVR